MLVPCVRGRRHHACGMELSQKPLLSQQRNHARANPRFASGVSATPGILGSFSMAVRGLLFPPMEAHASATQPKHLCLPAVVILPSSPPRGVVRGLPSETARRPAVGSARTD